MSATTARSSAVLLGGRVVGNAGFFVGVLVLARALGPSGRGTIAFVTVVALVVAHVAAFGITSATQVFAAQRGALRPRLLTNALLFSAVSGAVLAVATALLLASVDTLRPPGVSPALLVLLVPAAIGITLVEAGYSFMTGTARFGRQALITAVVPWLYAAGLLGVAAASEITVMSAAAVWVANTALWAVLLIASSAAGVGLGRLDPGLLRESVAFGARAWAGSLALFLTARVDQVVLALLATEAALGIYAVAVNGAEIALYVPAMAAAAFAPAIAVTAAHERAPRALAAFRQLVLVTAVVVAVGASAGAVLIPVVFGEAFGPSVGPYLWLLPGALGFVALQLFSTLLLAAGAPLASSVGPVVALLVSFVLDLALIPRYEASGAAVAATVGLLAGGIAATIAFRRRLAFGSGELVPRAADARALLARLAR